MSELLNRVRATIQAQNLRYVRFVFTDNAGIIRAKAVHTAALGSLLPDAGVGITVAQQAFPAMYDGLAPGSGLTPAGEVFMRADWNTFVPLPYASGHARVFTDIYDGDRPWAHCPRSFLRRMIDRAASYGLQLKAAFENEFTVFQPDGNGLAPVDQSVFAQTSSLDRMTLLLNDISDALEAQRVVPELLHAESAPGQFELPVRYAGALTAADQQVIFRETVGAVALRHDLIASFVPKILADRAGSGAHLHFSLWQGEENVVGNPDQPGTLSSVAAAFIAGLLHHLPALMAITTPTPNSFKRIRPHFWSGAYACWGYGNREAAIRVPATPVPGAPHTHLELKTVDATCNPYLAIGAVLAAGLDGLERELTLGDPVQLDPGDLMDAERQARGIFALPASLDHAIAALEQDTVLLDALGRELARSFLAVRRAEWEGLKDVPHEEEVRLLLQRY